MQKDRSQFSRILVRRQRRSQSAAAVLVTGRQRDITSTSWSDILSQARRFGLGLCALGVERGQVVGVVVKSGPECVIVVLGALLMGVGIADLGDGNEPLGLCESFRRSDCRLAICGERDQVDGLASTVRQQCGERGIIGWGAASSVNGVIPFGQVCLKGAELAERELARAEQLIDAVTLDDTALVLPDSRRDGSMRCVRLSHDNCIVAAESLRKSLGLTKEDRLIQLGHDRGLLETTLMALTTMLSGASVIHDLGELSPLVLTQTARPTILFSDADRLDVVHRELEHQLLIGAVWRRNFGSWAKRVGIEAAHRRISGSDMGTLFSLNYWVADYLVLSELRRLLGGQLRRIVVPASGSRRQTRWFFEAMGLSPLSMMGVPESSGIGLLELPDDPRPGSYGRAMPGVDVWVDSAGRIRIRGANVVRGAANVDERGWLDLEIFGEIDDEGMIWPESSLGALDAPSLAILPIAEQSENVGQ